MILPVIGILLFLTSSMTLPASSSPVQSSPPPNSAGVPVGSSSPVSKEPSPAATGPEEGLLNIRDPFRMPDLQGEKIVAKSDLEKFSVDSFKLVGVLTGPDRIQALMLAPDGKTYFAAEKMKIGLNGGIIRKITPEQVFVREKTVNLVGQEENLDSVIQLPSEAIVRSQAASENRGLAQ